MSSFLWHVIDNVRVYINSVHDPFDIEMHICRSFFVIFGILGLFFVFCIIVLSFLDLF
jgi:hypothetical protein